MLGTETGDTFWLCSRHAQGTLAQQRRLSTASQALRLSSTMTLVAQLDKVFDISYTCDVARTLHAGLLSDYGKSCIKQRS